jgi:hypothetical protein
VDVLSERVAAGVTERPGGEPAGWKSCALSSVTSFTSLTTSHNASSSPLPGALVDVSDTREATSHKAPKQS